MVRTTESESLGYLDRSAWKRLEWEFPNWVHHLDTQGNELEFVVPAPTSSHADHLIVFTHENQIWVRFSPPQLCYPADNEDQVVWLVKQLSADELVFKVTKNGTEWEETTLVSSSEKLKPLQGRSVQTISWSGRFDDAC
jgi:hypothetical protein